MASRPLFERYPRLREAIPLVELADLPTPVRALEGLSRDHGLRVWLKDDGPSSAAYGGNKVRKLELLLAAAKRAGAKRVLTFGYAGSNHATATAVHARSLGLGSISCLLPQENAAYLRSNLLASAAVGCELHEYGSRPALVVGAVAAIVRGLARDRALPYIIAPGGSSPLGTIGFVNAAFELAAQIEHGELPVPERVYAAGGSLGTVVGLALGFAAAGLATQTIAVRVVDEEFVNVAKARALATKTVALLCAADPSFPDVAQAADGILFRSEFFGGRYARETPQAAEASELAAREGLALDVTYTSKALACLVADARDGKGEGPVLFWNTCNSASLVDLASRATSQDLPRRLRRYFEA
jgi:1-aminocyclopropane-1-carboxylate deaminase/D-cysteine desulfhydrase-like pyridoxal-dependent ACC family enzyme